MDIQLAHRIDVCVCVCVCVGVCVCVVSRGAASTCVLRACARNVCERVCVRVGLVQDRF